MSGQSRLTLYSIRLVVYWGRLHCTLWITGDGGQNPWPNYLRGLLLIGTDHIYCSYPTEHSYSGQQSRQLLALSADLISSHTTMSDAAGVSPVGMMGLTGCPRSLRRTEAADQELARQLLHTSRGRYIFPVTMEAHRISLSTILAPSIRKLLGSVR